MVQPSRIRAWHWAVLGVVVAVALPVFLDARTVTFEEYRVAVDGTISCINDRAPDAEAEAFRDDTGMYQITLISDPAFREIAFECREEFLDEVELAYGETIPDEVFEAEIADAIQDCLEAQSTEELPADLDLEELLELAEGTVCSASEG